jgi:type I site-specific restriction endonuclease
MTVFSWLCNGTGKTFTAFRLFEIMEIKKLKKKNILFLLLTEIFLVSDND